MFRARSDHRYPPLSLRLKIFRAALQNPAERVILDVGIIHRYDAGRRLERGSVTCWGAPYGGAGGTGVLFSDHFDLRALTGSSPLPGLGRVCNSTTRERRGPLLVCMCSASRNSPQHRLESFRHYCRRSNINHFILMRCFAMQNSVLSEMLYQTLASRWKKT